MENKTAAKVLSSAFKGLRNAQTISDLNWFHSYISGAMSALIGTGCVSNEEHAKILARSNAIYNERGAEITKKADSAMK